MTTGSTLANFGAKGRVHHPGGHAAWRHSPARSAAAAIALLSLMAAGCAAIRTSSSDERQAVIARIVGASAKVVLEEGDRRVASGSGVVVMSGIEEPGIGSVSYVLTAAHILDGREGARVFVRFAGPYGLRGKYGATVFRRGNAEALDLALLRVPGIAVPSISLPPDDRVHLGEGIWLVGFPWGKRLGLFSGIVSQVPGEGEEDATAEEGDDQTIVVDAAAAKGVSGGGVFRESTGNLLGVVEGYQTASIAVKDRSRTYSVRVPMPGETLVVPISRIRRFLEEAGLGQAFRLPGRIQDRKD